MMHHCGIITSENRVTFTILRKMSRKQWETGDFGLRQCKREGGKQQDRIEWMKWFNVSESASPPGNGTIWAPNWLRVNCLSSLTHSHCHTCFLFHSFCFSWPSVRRSLSLSHTHMLQLLSGQTGPVLVFVLDKQRPVLVWLRWWMTTRLLFYRDFIGVNTFPDGATSQQSSILAGKNVRSFMEFEKKIKEQMF